jgi:hypothetical protein
VAVRHVPVPLVRALATVAALRPAPLLTRYALDQLSDGMVLDTGRAAALGWTGPSRLGDVTGAAAGRQVSSPERRGAGR